MAAPAKVPTARTGESSLPHGRIDDARRPGTLEKRRLQDGDDGLGPSLRAVTEPLSPTLGGHLSASRFPLVGQLTKHAHERRECSVTQHGELLGGHLTASFNLREVRPVVGDAVGQVLLV